MAPKEPKEPMRLLVAVDFGTTFSGVAYLQTLNHQKQTVIQDWGEAGGEGEKVPTTLKYDLGQFSPPRFGFNIDDDEDGKIEWFKLGLYPNVEETSLAKKYPIKTPKMSDSECKRHVVIYLTALREHTDTYLKDRFGDAFWRSTPREYIITVPAIWQDKSKDTTLVCAEKAGMGPRNKIQVVAEPEAAGIYALQSMENIDLKVNDTFVICDAGGGTIDLVSYTVNSLKPIPVIGEVVVGSGALCGGTFLDRIFAEYLTNKFHDYGPWDDEYQAAALKVFEKDIKRKFAGDTSRTYTIRVRQLPDNSALGIRRGFLEIPGKDIKRVFEPVVREIVKRVKLQIQATESKAKKVKAVLLAGGFGRNEYLRSRLKDELGVNIDVRKVENSNTSIVRGALIYGLAKKVPRLATFLVDTNIARRNYGTRCWLPLTSEYDPRKTETTKDDVTGETRVYVMKWFLKKGAPVKESDPPKNYTFCVEQPVDEGPLQPLNLDIYVCEDKENMGPPVYPGHRASVSMKLRADFSHIPTSRLNKERGTDNRLYYKEYFEIEMTLSSASLQFTLIHKGDRYQTIQVEFL